MYDVTALRQAEFPWTDQRIYLAHAAIGPLRARTRAVTDAYNRDRSMPSPCRHSLVTDFGIKITWPL